METEIKQEIEKMKCLNCGITLEAEQKLCQKCDEKIKLENKTVINSVKNKYQRKIKEINKRRLGIIAITIVILAIASFTFIKISPKILISTDDLLTQGNYEEAYKKAKSEEKEEIYYENAIAYVSSKIIEAYKDPSSFELRKAWIDKTEKRIVLKTAGKNSFGGITTSYQYITYNKDEKKYKLFCSLSDLDNEKTYSFDDASDKLEKILKNAVRKIVKEIIQKDNYKVSNKTIDNINHLMSQKLLDTVTPLEEIGETEKI